MHLVLSTVRRGTCAVNYLIGQLLLFLVTLLLAHSAFKQRPPAGDVRVVRSIGLNLRGLMVNKVGRQVQFESALERSLLLRFERDRTIRDYRSQPEEFSFTDNQGRLRHYTPDFLVWRIDGRIEIHEVTCSWRRDGELPHLRRLLRQPRLSLKSLLRTQQASRLREAAARRVCRVRGWQYCVHVESDLPGPTELTNLLALSRYRPRSYGSAAVLAAASSLLATTSWPIGRLIAALSAELRLPEPQVVGSLFHAIWYGELEIDLVGGLLFDGGAPVPSIHVWAHKEAC